MPTWRSWARRSLNHKQQEPSMPEEIDLNDEEEAALERAWRKLAGKTRPKPKPTRLATPNQRFNKLDWALWQECLRLMPRVKPTGELPITVGRLSNGVQVQLVDF